MHHIRKEAFRFILKD